MSDVRTVPSGPKSSGPPDAIGDRLAKARARRGRRLGTEPTEVVFPRRPEGVLPLASAQRRFWFARQLAQTDPFVVPVVVRLHGTVDADRLERACLGVVARHLPLRTRIVELEGEPVAELDDAPIGGLRVIDLSGERAEAQDLVVDAVTEFAYATFDLATEQPWRTGLFRTSQDEALFVMSVHHVACDGWSIGLILDEIGSAYAGREPEQPTIDFGDYAHYRALPEGLEGGCVDYWREHLAGAPAALDLPTDRPRAGARGLAAAELVRDLSPDARRALSSVMTQTSTTAYMALLATLHLVLARWSGQDDIVVGGTVAGRTRREVERLVGCFVGTVAVRTTSAPERSRRDVLSECRDAVLGALVHQNVGYESVVEALGAARSTSMTGLYQVSLTVHSESTPELVLPGVTTEWVRLPSRDAQCDLAISAHGDLARGADGADLTLTLEYPPALFDAATIERLVGHMEQVLVELAADIDAPVKTLRLLTDAEWAELPELVGAGISLDAGELGDVASGHVTDRVWAWADLTPDAPAVTSRGQTLSYAGLRSRALGVAAALRSSGVVAGDRVGLFTERSVEALVGMLGILESGAAYVPVDPSYPDSRVNGILDGASVTTVLAQAHLVDRVRAGREVLPIESLPVQEPGDPRDNIVRRGDDLAYVLFTSGTTGAPKGVAVEHRHLLTYVAGARQVLGIEPGWAWATMSTLSADLGLTNVFGALTSGGNLHVLTYEQAVDPAAVAGYFASHRIDAMKLVPSHLAALWDVDRPTAVLPERLIVLAGEALPWDLVERIRAAMPSLRIHNHYGPTETTVSTMARAVTDVRTSAVVPLGRPFPGTHAHVVDSLGRPVPTGVPGELWIAGPTVSRGYLGRDDLTAERFVAEPVVAPVAEPDESGTSSTGPTTGLAYRTGDRVRRRPGGDVEFLGRVDDQVKVRGYRVEPGEIARVVSALDTVEDCVVVLREDTGRAALVAYVVPAGALESDAATENLVAAARAHVRASLPDYMVPADFVVIDRIPLTPNGKTDRAALPAPERRAVESGRAVTGPVELRVAAAWSHVLAVEVTGAEDNFFEVGGDSFSTVRVVRALDGDVSVVDIFTHPTVAGLAQLIEARSRGEKHSPEGLLRPLGARPGAAGLHVVCVPFGGGSPVAFMPLADEMPDGVAVHGVALPGHDTSRPDEPLRPLGELAVELAEEIGRLDGDVVLYGHCLGGALAAQTALEIERRGGSLLGVVEAGTFPAARLPGRIARALHKMLPSDRLTSDRAYLESLRSLGGFTDDLDPADQALLMRALRHDNREAENYYTARDDAPGGDRLEAPILCVVGERDRATELYQERFDEWRDFSDDVALEVIEGAGHFFPRHQAGELAGLITEHARLWQRGERVNTPGMQDDVAAPSVRTFLLVATTQLLSMIGTGLTSFALGIWVLQRTGSVSAFATIAAMAVLPAIVALPFAGAVADRYDRRRVMLIADGVAGVMTAALVVLLLRDGLTIGFVYAFAAMGALAGAFQRPAYLAAITQLVPKRYLGQAGGFVSLGINAGDLIAALAGGVIVGTFGLGTAVAVDVVTFASAMAVLAFVRFPNRLWVRREEGFRAEILGGFRYIAARREMQAMVIFFVVFNYLFSFPVGLATPLVLAGTNPQTLGVVTAVGGAGAVVGSIVMAAWGGTRRRALGMVGATSIVGLAVVVLGISNVPVLQALGLAGVYGALLVVNAHWLSLIQAKVGLDLQGRVLSINQMLATMMMPLGFLSIAPVSEWVGTHLAAPGKPFHSWTAWLEGAVGADAAGLGLTLVLTGLVLVVWGALGLAWRPLRRMDLTLPDAIPDAVISSDRDVLQAQADARLS